LGHCVGLYTRPGLFVATEASHQRQRDVGRLSDEEENLAVLILIFVVIPLLGFSILIVFIYRRVANNRSTYRGAVFARSYLLLSLIFFAVVKTDKLQLT